MAATNSETYLRRFDSDLRIFRRDLGKNDMAFISSASFPLLTLYSVLSSSPRSACFAAGIHATDRVSQIHERVYTYTYLITYIL